jgi:hypothetical protein
VTEVSYNTSTDKITITGSNFSDVNAITLKNGSTTVASLTIESKTSTTIIAYVTSTLSLVAGTLYDLVIANATAATTATIYVSPLDNSVTAAKIVDGAVGTAKLADSSVNSAKIIDSVVTTAKLANDAVTTLKILDSAVTTAKIADSAVTSACKDSR